MEYVPGLVYDNLVKMMTYRGAELVSTPLAQNEVIEQLNHREYITIIGNRPAGDQRGQAKIVLVLIAPGSHYADKTPNFRDLLKILTRDVQSQTEFVFVSEQVFTAHLKKHIATIKDPNISIEDYDYRIFIIETPKHVSVPRHEIATEEEIEFVFKYYYMSRDQCPRILRSDPIAVWMGLKPGMVVAIGRISETAGIAPIWRVCVK